MLELKHLCFEAETDDGVRQILKDVSLTVDERMVVITLSLIHISEPTRH